MSSNARGGSSPPSRTILSPGSSRALPAAATAADVHVEASRLGARATVATLLSACLMMAACGTPAGIVTEAAQAAAAGDHGAYVACFTPRSRALLKTMYATAEQTRPDLAVLGGSAVTVSQVRGMSVGIEGRDRAVVTVTEDGRSIPLVLHRLAGAWRIDLMDSERVLSGLGTSF